MNEDKNTTIKQFILQNPATLMQKYFEHTFHIPMLFYHQKKDICMHIVLKDDIQIPWTTFEYVFSHIQKNKPWNESTTVFIRKKDALLSKALGEFQVHNHRDCIKFRFDLQTVLNEFPEYFETKNL